MIGGRGGMRRASALCACCVASIAGCASAPSRPASVRVISFTQGLMRQSPDRTWSIYEPGDRFAYRENGRCHLAGVAWVPCMWHGFVLEFSAEAERSVLECVAGHSVATNVVDISGVKGRNVTKAEWTIKLAGRSGVYAHPQFTAADPEHPAQVANVATTVCRESGIEILRFVFEVEPSAQHGGG